MVGILLHRVNATPCFMSTARSWGGGRRGVPMQDIMSDVRRLPVVCHTPDTAGCGSEFIRD